MRPCIPSFILALVFAIPGAHAFPFTHSDPTECGDLTVNWEGGSPPFRLLIIPNGHTLRNLSIPDDAYDGSRGSFAVPMPWSAGTEVALAMSDSTGITAGGISPLLTLGGPTGGATCDTSIQVADFFYSLDRPLQQCADFPFTNFGGARQPVSVFGFVPNGDSFSVEGVTGDTVNWRANQRAGTNVLFYMTDSLGRNGGVTLRTVGESSDASCLPLAQPSSSAPTQSSNSSRPPSSTSSASRKPTSTSDVDDGSSTDDEEEKKGGSNIGIIVGAAAGGFVALGVFAFIAVFCFKRKKRQSAAHNEVKIDIDGPPGALTSPSNTYLLPSAYNGSNSNLAPSQAAAPYAQDSYSSSLSYAPMGASLNTRPSYQATTPSPTVPSEFNPYSPNPVSTGGLGGHSSQNSTSAASNVDPYGGISGGQSAAGYPPSNYGVAAGAAAAAGAGAYGAYNQYQRNQYPPYSQSSQQGYNMGAQGPLYATNADPPSTPYSAYPPSVGGSSSIPTHYPHGSIEKQNPPPQSPPQRVIQHQDIDEAMDIPDELPPQYSERRAPIPGLPSSYGGASHNPDRKS